MQLTQRARSGIRLVLAVVTAAAVAGVVVSYQPDATAAQSNFVGGDPTRPDSSDIRALRLRFEAGFAVELAQPFELADPDGRGGTRTYADPRPGNPGIDAWDTGLRRTRCGPLARRGA